MHNKQWELREIAHGTLWNWINGRRKHKRVKLVQHFYAGWPAIPVNYERSSVGLMILPQIQMKLGSLILPGYVKIIFWLSYSCTTTLLSLFGPGMWLPVELFRRDINNQAEHFGKLIVPWVVLREKEPCGLDGWPGYYTQVSVAWNHILKKSWFSASLW